jgi:hypothetical protein
MRWRVVTMVVCDLGLTETYRKKYVRFYRKAAGKTRGESVDIYSAKHIKPLTQTW